MIKAIIRVQEESDERSLGSRAGAAIRRSVKAGVLACSLALLALPGTALALGLGGVEVDSALNEPLQARISVSATAEELSSASVILASGRDFERVGLERDSMLEFLSIRLVTDDGEPYVSVTSSDPIREPFLSFLLDVNWANGRMLREYTLLLDPPVYAPASSVAPAPTVSAYQDDPPASADPQAEQPASSSPAQPAVSSRPAQSSDTSSSAASQDSYVSYQGQNEYGPVASGDTLWEIARDWRPDQSLTINQTMVALLRANPDAFIENNINNLRRGAVLRIPEADEIRRISQAEAMAAVRTQNALWQDYRQALSRSAPTVTDPSSSSYSSVSSTASSSDDARLELVPPRAGEDSGSDASALRGAGTSETVTQLRELQDELARAQEDLAASEAEGDELQSRVADLESVVDKLQRALNLREDELAGLQAQLAASNDEDVDASISDLASAANDPFALDEDASEDGADAGFGDQDPSSLSDSSLTDDGAADQIVDDILADLDSGSDEFASTDSDADAGDLASDSADPAAADSDTQTSLADSGDQSSDDGADVAQSTPAASQPLPSRPERPWWHFFTTPIGWGVIALVLIILAIVVFMMRRGGGDSEGREHDTLISNLVKKKGGAPEMEAEPMPEVMDDVALASAIASDPDNENLHLQLAKYYFANGQDDRFVGAAEAMHARLGSDSEAWHEVAELGAQIMPDNPLFADSTGTSDGELDADMDAGLMDAGEADRISETAVMPELSGDEFGGMDDADGDAGGDADELEPLEFTIDGDDGDADEDEFPTLEIEDLEGGADFAEEAATLERETIERDADAQEDDDVDDQALFGAELSLDDDDDGDDDFGFELEGSADDLGDLAESLSEDDDDRGTDATGLDLAAVDLDQDQDEPAEDQADDEDDLSFDFDMGDRRAVSAPSGEDADHDAGDDADAEEPEEDQGDVLDAAEQLLADLDTDDDALAASARPDDLAVDDSSDESDAASADSASEDSTEEVPAANMMDTGEHDLGEMATSEIDLDLDDDDLFGNEDPVTTKLDLARAYVDMGDPEGARNMLEEVVDEGSDDQQTQAKRLLDDLDESDS